MTQCYIPPEIIKAHKLFPNSGYLRFKWLENQRYLKKRNLGNNGGWFGWWNVFKRIQIFII